MNKSSCHNESNSLRPVYRQVPDDNENNIETLIDYNRYSDGCDANFNGKVMYAGSNF